jgi:DNA-binding Lrp family transcriptional regulator
MNLIIQTAGWQSYFWTSPVWHGWEEWRNSGTYDLAAVVRVKTNDELSDLVTRKLADVDAILTTETMLAMRAYSKHDLEAMFELGM